MGAQHGHDENVGSERLDARDFGISRSRLGWLSVRFDGGPYYPAMLETLREMAELHGHLVRRGEKISGLEWIQRVNQSGARVTEQQMLAIGTLMGRI